jgi:hypothetical protein
VGNGQTRGTGEPVPAKTNFHFHFFFQIGKVQIPGQTIKFDEFSRPISVCCFNLFGVAKRKRNPILGCVTLAKTRRVPSPPPLIFQPVVPSGLADKICLRAAFLSHPLGVQADR